jgi:hypothetical protein
MTSLVLRPGYICTFQEIFDFLLGFFINRRNSLLHSASHGKIDGELRINKSAILVARIVLLLPELRGFAPSRDTRDFVARRNIDRRLLGCYEILAMKLSGVLLQPASSLNDEWIAISQAQKHGTGFLREHDTRRGEIDGTLFHRKI